MGIYGCSACIFHLVPSSQVDIGQNMAVGVTGTELIVRTEPDNFEAALALPYARSMDFTSSPMKGFINIKSTGLETDTALAVQVERSAGFARSLLVK